jgi:polyhydroxyalkanoate synthesis regulator phasin
MSSLESLGLVDEEIKARVEILINRGELAESEGRQLLDKLLSLDSQTSTEHTYPSDELIKEVLANKDLPTKNDLDKLVAQLDELASKLDNSIQNTE